MHGAGNRFALLDARGERGAFDFPAIARRLCAPQSDDENAGGFGVDGLLVIAEPPRDSDALATMRIFNADGGEAEMCGNGVRCVARHLYERGAPSRFTVATLAGPIALEIVSEAPDFRVRAVIGVPDVESRDLELDAGGAHWNFRRVSVGNPHAVAFVNDVDAVDLERLGTELNAAHPAFPQGINLHVVAVEGERRLRARHFERGVGLTQACGTGAVACAAVALRTERVVSPVKVCVPGGELKVAWNGVGAASLTGPAVVEFEREVSP